jgi:hypothetical protein
MFASDPATVARGQGGLYFLQSDLNQALFSEPGRPPFDNGNSVVGGVIMLGAAPSMGPLIALQSLLNLFLGSAVGTGAAVNTAVAQITTVIAETERVFGVDLEPISANGSPGADPVFLPRDVALAGTTVPPVAPVGAADKGNCGLLKTISPPVVLFADNLQPQ